MATNLLLGDWHWDQRALPHEYVLADLAGRPVPQVLLSGRSAASLTTQSQSLDASLSEDFICHLCACLLNISRRAAVAASNRRRRLAASSSSSTSGGGSSSSSSSSGAAGGSVGARGGGKKDKSGLAGVGSPARVSPKPAGPKGAPAADRSDRERDRDGINGSRDADDLALEGGLGVDDDEDEEAQMGAEELIPSHVYLSCDPATSAAPSPEWLDAFCSQSIKGPANSNPGAARQAGGSGAELSAIERAWICLARLDGTSGQLLGQALGGGCDGLRCWVCSLLLWSSRSARDPLLPKGAVQMRRCLDDLRDLCETHAAALGRDAAVGFVFEALGSLAVRAESIAAGSAGQLAVPRETAVQQGMRAASSIYQALLASLRSGLGRGRSLYGAVGGEAGVERAAELPQQHHQQQQFVKAEHLGRVIAVHCGECVAPSVYMYIYSMYVYIHMFVSIYMH